jgi:hypothetical protein
MKLFAYGALAWALCGLPALATDPALVTDNGWTSLDKEIDSLAASLASAEPSGPTIGGYLITSFRHSGDDYFTGGGGAPDQSGFQLDSVRLDVSGDVSDDYGYKVSFELSSSNGEGHGASPNGAATLRDAYVNWRIAEGVKGRMGRFKEAVVSSGMVSEQYLFFLDRTAIGDAFKVRDLGLMVLGNWDILAVWLSFQDGLDGQADEYKYTVRAQVDVIGKSRSKITEGAYGNGENTTLMFAAAFQDDTFLDDGMVIVAEAALGLGPVWIAAEVADIDEGTAGVFGRTLYVNDAADTTPWDATATFAITPEWEVGARYEDNDDVDDTMAYRFGVAYYVHGHDIKWQATWGHIDTDNAVGDSDQASVGLTLGF